MHNHIPFIVQTIFYSCETILINRKWIVGSRETPPKNPVHLRRRVWRDEHFAVNFIKIDGYLNISQWLPMTSAIRKKLVSSPNLKKYFLQHTVQSFALKTVRKSSALNEKGIYFPLS